MEQFLKLRYALVILFAVGLIYFIINIQSSQMDKRMKEQQELKYDTEQLTGQIAKMTEERNQKDLKLKKVSKLISGIQHLDTTREDFVNALESLSNTDVSVTLPITNTGIKQSK